MTATKMLPESIFVPVGETFVLPRNAVTKGIQQSYQDGKLGMIITLTYYDIEIEVEKDAN